ncbi:MAG: transposase [Pirellulales bacterium]
MTSPFDQLLAELAASRERIAELEAIVTARDASLSLLEATNVQLRQTIQQLSADQALLKRWRFGTRSERVVDDESQMLLFSTLELPEAATAAEPTVAPDAARHVAGVPAAVGDRARVSRTAAARETGVPVAAGRDSRGATGQSPRAPAFSRRSARCWKLCRCSSK